MPPTVPPEDSDDERLLDGSGGGQSGARGDGGARDLSSLQKAPISLPPSDDVEPIALSRRVTNTRSPKARERAGGLPHRSSFGRIFARVLCLIFGFVGLLPLILIGLLKTDAVREAISDKTSELLRRELGIEATFDASFGTFPLALKATSVTIEGEPGTGPFVQVEEARVTPRLFSLLSGRLNAGNVEISGAYVKVVLKEGELQNWKPRFPESEDHAPSSPLTELPFRSLSLTDVALDLDLEGTRIRAAELDLDAIAEGGLATELGLRLGAATITRKARHPGDVEASIDEDRLCRFELRARVDPEDAITVRRLEVQGSADFDPAPNTRPACDLPKEDWRRLDLRLGAVRVPVAVLEGNAVNTVSGRVEATVPVGLAHRWADLPRATGSASVNLTVYPTLGTKLPWISGNLSAHSIGIDGKIFSDEVTTDLRVDERGLEASQLRAHWADGDFSIGAATLDFRTLTLKASAIDARNVELQGLLRDLGAHPQAHVGWHLREIHFDAFGGTLNPLALEGALRGSTEGFGIYDRPAHRSDRGRMLSLDEGDVTGSLVIQPDAVVLRDMQLTTPRSQVRTTVSLGFHSAFGLRIEEGSRIDLSEISPIVSVPMTGIVDVMAIGDGDFTTPHISGDLSIDGFSIAGFEAGRITEAHADFVPLALRLSNVALVKNESAVSSPDLLVAFDQGPDVLVEADVDVSKPPFLQLTDFMEVFHFSEDPRFESFSGLMSGHAHVHYLIGGPDDRCGGGVLDVTTRVSAVGPTLFGEKFDRGQFDVRFLWDDQSAGSAGMKVRIPSATLSDGTGTIALKAELGYGGILTANVVAGAIPLSRIEGLGSLAPWLDGEASVIGNVRGTLSAIRADLDVGMGPMRFGSELMAPSRLSVEMVPAPEAPAKTPLSRCGNPIAGEFDRALYDADLSGGDFVVNGSVFGDQIDVRELRFSQQRNRVVRGSVKLRELDVGKLTGALPRKVLEVGPIEAKVTGGIEIAELRPSALHEADLAVSLDAMEISREKNRLSLERPVRGILFKGNQLTLPEIPIQLELRQGLKTELRGAGTITDVLSPSPTLKLGLALVPFDLGVLAERYPDWSPAGTVAAEVSISGASQSPEVAGFATLRDGGASVPGTSMSIDHLNADIELGEGEIRLARLSSNIGAGTLNIVGRAPLLGREIGAASLVVTGRGLKLPTEDGVEAVVDLDLDTTLPATNSEEGTLPDVHGKVTLLSAAYRKPISLSVDLAKISRDLGRSDAQALDPAGDFLSFALTVVSRGPIVVENDLADVRLEVQDRGLEISGTNQRYGARGSLKLLADSKLRLRNHEFDVQEGLVRFEDPSKIRAEVDVRARTELRRSASAGASSGAAGGGAAPDSGASSSATGGRWEVGVHAYGPTDDLKLDLSSNPTLDQDDIVLLLTMGMTRAEIDRGLASSLGETVGLEALSALTGAGNAVREVVPMIDYFHFGSSYSARTGRTEPNVTVGKRLTEDVRASVTTTLTERDVAATLEWQLRKGLSLEGSYDNTNDTGTLVGNLGADLRWRLEFE